MAATEPQLALQAQVRAPRGVRRQERVLTTRQMPGAQREVPVQLEPAGALAVRPVVVVPGAVVAEVPGAEDLAGELLADPDRYSWMA